MTSLAFSFEISALSATIAANSFLVMDFSSVDSTVGSTVGKYVLFNSYLYHPITITPLVRGHNSLPAKIDYYFCYLSGLHMSKITTPAH